MTLELKSAELGALEALHSSWFTSRDAELEATFQKLNYIRFLDGIKYLRSLGLTEEPQPPKLNILVSGGLRFTLVGSSAIQAYCVDNTLKGKPFHVIIKEKKAVAGGASEVDLNEYGVRIKVRREIMLPVSDPRVIDALQKWSTLPKAFRYIQRYSFTSAAHTGIIFDASYVKENRKDGRGQYIQDTTFMGAGIHKQQTHYEFEVEARPGAALKTLLTGVTLVLRGMQKSYVLVRESVRQEILAIMSAQTSAPKGSFPGSQPKTLRRAHMGVDPEPDTPNLRSGDYNVTDKADGLRCLMVVNRNGRIYLVDRNLNVYGTDRRLDDSATAEWAGAVLDGEWVTQDATGAPYSRYYAFDIFNGIRGEDVSSRPFLVRSESAVSRLAAMTAAIAALNSAGKLFPVPARNSLGIFMKTFETPMDTSNPNGIFESAAAVLERVSKDAPYHTDGLIFTPNAMPLAKNVNTWPQQLKWKPASQNSVDFLVLTEKERGVDGKQTATELIDTRFQDDTGSIVRYKTLRLFVGSSADPAFADPRTTILEKRPYPARLEHSGGMYRPVEFSPQPPDPMGSVCYVAISAGSTDASGAATKGVVADDSDTIYTDETHEPIANRTIVEMVYDPKKPAGWRWKPMRIRWDKTELFQRGQVGGTMNADFVANDVWSSIHDPITETMIKTGSVIEHVEVAEGREAGANSYYQRKANQRDQYKVRGLQEFHNRYIKEDLLLGRVLTAGSALLDLSVGQAGDIHKWIRGRAGWVLGTDIALSGLIDPKNGAYSRLLTQMILKKGAVPPMLFVQADSSMRLTDGSAGIKPEDRAMLRALWGSQEVEVPPYVAGLRGRAASGFDIATLMFSLHYFFKDRTSLDGLLMNLAETVKVGGYMVGCCFDGDTVANMLRDLPLGGTRRGTEDATDIWTITKKYSGSVLPASDEGLGKAIDVGFISIGEMYTEYLVSFPYFTEMMGHIGFELLNAEECAGMGLNASSHLFKDSHAMAANIGRNFAMTSAVSTFSFLNRWFIFRRRSSTITLRAPERVAVTTSVRPQGSEAAAELAAEVLGPDASVSAAAATATTAAATATIAAPTTGAVTAAGAGGPEAAAVAAAAAENVVADGALPADGDRLELALADGPIYQFYHKSVAKDEIRVGDKNWRRYLSTYAPFRYTDLTDPSIHYTSLEAAIGAAKFQIATNKPQLGAATFSEAGSIHQDIEQKKAALLLGVQPGGAAGAGGAAVPRALTAAELAAFVEEEGNAYRDSHKLPAIRKLGAKWNADAWLAARERVLNTYVRQRFELDGHFKKILEAVSAMKARLVYYAAGTGTELSGSIKSDATIEGENLYGKALLRLVGLRY